MKPSYTFSSSYPKRFPDWQSEFEAVLLEGDILKLPTLVEVAQAAILVRQQCLPHTADGYSERNAI